MSAVLVVDDKEMLRDSVAVTLQRAGFTVLGAPDGKSALELIAQRRPDAVVSDLRMPGMDGLELIEQARRIDEDLPIVLMTAFGAIETAVRALKLGAYDYITKPFEGDELVVAVKRAIEHARVKRENEILRASGDRSAPGPACGDELRGLDRIIGDAPAIAGLKREVEAIASSHGAVLITGESGVGKEVIARAIHDLSPRSDEPFLAVNCAAMSESLLESELFGHEKGSFTGAERLRKGRFELAHGGTLVLDEISEVRTQIQAKLLRVLQERQFERVGSSTSIGVDVRVVATSNRNLEVEVGQGRFRQDLFFRLNVLPLRVPPLRDRASDVEPLARHFVERAWRREGRSPLEITPQAMSLLMGYDWPGNVRELQNLCERAVVLAKDSRITAELIAPWLSHSMPAPVAAGVTLESKAPARDVLPGVERELRPLAEIEREVIVRTLEHFKGHRQKTAQALGIGVRTLGLKLKKWKELQLVAQSL
jgi:DNA-binding NtrC family response regulator